MFIDFKIYLKRECTIGALRARVAGRQADRVSCAGRGPAPRVPPRELLHWRIERRLSGVESRAGPHVHRLATRQRRQWWHAACVPRTLLARTLPTSN